MKSFLILVSITASFFLKAQMLDKKIYLLDDLDSTKISSIDLSLLKNAFKQYHICSSDTDRIQILSSTIENCYDEKIWTRYNKLMLDIAIKKQNGATAPEIRIFRESEALALNNIGYYFFNYSSYLDSSLIYYEKALKINEELQSYGNMIVSYSNIANIYQNKGNFLKAIDLYNKALSLESKTVQKQGVLSSMNNLSNIYMYLGDTTTSLLYLKRCFLLAQQSKDENMKAHLLHNMGAIIATKNVSKGIQSIKTALSLRKKIGDKKGMAHSMLMLSTLTLKVKDVNASTMYLREAKQIIDETKSPSHIALYHRNLAQIAALRGNEAEAMENFVVAIEQFKLGGAINDMVETLSNAIAYFENKPKFKQQRLEFIEQYYINSKRLNISAAQKVASQLRYENEIKLREAEQRVKDEKSNSENRKQKIITATIAIVLAVTLLFCILIFKALRSNREKTKTINKQKLLVEEKQKEIIDSINYSKRIQNSFIPSVTEFEDVFPNSFVIYQPKDIVSGDFYWLMDSKHYPSIKQNFKAIAVADCTGHGVPGAMLSMLGSSLLNQAILESNVRSSADVLNFLNLELKKNLRSKNNEIIRDGMDIACCLIEQSTLKMQFAGANNPCWIMRDNSIVELKADKLAVTASMDEEYKPFTNKEYQLQKGDMLFLFTDGFADQFGGPRGKKFMYSRLEKMLVSSASMSASDQKEFLTKEFLEWKGQLDQVDDVCLIGIKI